jgi:inner membrane transporter RhtA
MIAVHHLCFYEALHRLPLGIAVTFEFIGPLAVALYGSKRMLDLMWAVLATAGVAAAADITGISHFGAIGIAFALCAGACWAGYIVLFPLLSSHTGRRQGLALCVTWAAIIVMPYGIFNSGSQIFHGHTLLLGAVVAVLSDVAAFTLQSGALDRISSHLFSILSSTEPAVGAILGLIVLDQYITGVQWIGILAVIVASVAATRSHKIAGDI